MVKNKRKLCTLFLAGMFAISSSTSAIFAATAAVPTGEVVRPDQDSAYVENQLLVVYKEDSSQKNINRYIKQSDAIDAETTTAVDGQQLSVVTLEEDTSVEEAMEDFAESPIVAYVQPNYLYRRAAEPVAKADVNDTNWHLDAINLDSAQRRYGYATDDGIPGPVTVAVLDTGADITHPDLQAHLNRDLSVEILPDGTTTPLTGDSDIFDGHGTHVCGIIGATAGNGIGGDGVASSVLGDQLNLVAINVFDFFDEDEDYGNGDGINDWVEHFATTADLVAGLAYAQEIGADVINMSLGGYYTDPLEEAAVAACIDDGITVVAAAGNDDTSQYCYPADFDDVIAVIATTASNNRASFSNYGSSKEICAPGVNIYSTVPETLMEYDEYGYNTGNTVNSGGYAYMSGTSMASPVVAGTAAILCSINPKASRVKVKNAIIKTAKDIGTEGKDNYTAYGLLDAGEAAEYVLAPSTPTGVSASLSTKSSTSSTNYRTLRLSWNKMSGASGYRIAYRRSSSSSWTTLNVSSSTSSYTKKLTAGKKYYVKVRAYKIVDGIKFYSPYCSTKTIYTLKQPNLNDIQKTSKGNNKLRWTNISGETGYQIYKRKGKTGKWYTVQWRSANKNYYTDSSVKNGIRYYYKVRAYKTVNGKKVYGPWSDIESRYVKK